jgi:hypothetical protein
MPSIDLARLRKQAARLADFFYVPDDFARQLNTVLDAYVNHTRRKAAAVAPGMHLPSHRTPAVVLKQIEQELTPLATARENAEAALALADRLWDEGSLETRLLAGFLLGRMVPQEGRLIARISAWAVQAHDSELRSRLLDTSLLRMRKEAPEMFLELLQEWLRPERRRYWRDAIRAAISAVGDPGFVDLPRFLKILEPVVREAPSDIQLELEELILALYKLSPAETAYFVRQVLSTSDDPMTAITFRRMSASLPAGLTAGIRDLIRKAPTGVR